MAVNPSENPSATSSKRKTSKQEWREWAFNTRQALPDRSKDVTRHLRPFLHEHGVRRVLAYRALPGEPDVSALDGEFELFTTRTRYRPDRHLTIHPWHTATEHSKFGYLQPPAHAPTASLSSMDAVLLPGLAFDTQGMRLGYGGGFYDRLLPGYAGLTVGVVWAALLLPELPSETHDCAVGWLATEKGFQKTDTTCGPVAET